MVVVIPTKRSQSFTSHTQRPHRRGSLLCSRRYDRLPFGIVQAGPLHQRIVPFGLLPNRSPYPDGRGRVTTWIRTWVRTWVRHWDRIGALVEIHSIYRFFFVFWTTYSIYRLKLRGKSLRFYKVPCMTMKKWENIFIVWKYFLGLSSFLINF